jgi:hypothetical protein
MLDKQLVLPTVAFSIPYGRSHSSQILSECVLVFKVQHEKYVVWRYL